MSEANAAFGTLGALPEKRLDASRDAEAGGWAPAFVAQDVATSVAATSAAASVKVGGAGRGDAMKSLSILIVEDDPMIGPLLAEMLEDLGHFICGVEVNAIDAVAAAARYHPDLMIVDVGLGEKSGVAAVKEILSRGFVPHVFVTGDILRNLRLGPGAILIQKPFRGPEIVAAIQRAVASPSKPVADALL
jgi:two-component system, response regulator PdtaR